MTSQFRPALTGLLLLSALTGIAYPLAVTALAHLAFPRQAGGSLIRKDGHVVGSALIGRAWTDPGTFWGRPSATSPAPYDASASGGSNLAPSNPDLRKAVEARIQALRAADPTQTAPLPVDLVTASASGLDPHISPAAAEWQIPRVARARGLDEARVRALVEAHIERPQLGFLGEPRVNVQRLNLDLEPLR
jgi:K+-transporting ATPase ATPase C chain